MLRAFNMGMGMCIFVSFDAAVVVARWFAALFFGSRVVG